MTDEDLLQLVLEVRAFRAATDSDDSVAVKRVLDVLKERGVGRVGKADAIAVLRAIEDVGLRVRFRARRAGGVDATGPSRAHEP